MITKAMHGILLFALLLSVACQNKTKKSSKTFYTTIGSEPSTLNPFTGATEAPTTSVLGYIYETLLERDLDTYEWKPYLATDWTISDDKKTFDFTLRPGVKWHDGKELTAEDVKFSYDAVMNDEYGAIAVRPYYDSIESVEVLDKYKVRFKVKDDYFGNFSTVATMTILPKHIYKLEDKKEWGKKLVGSGPYLFTTYDKGQKIILTQNKDWWGRSVDEIKDTFQVPKMYLRFVSEENVQLELLKKGDLDFLALRPESFVKRTEGKIWDDRITKVKTENKTPKGYNFIGWNNKHPILKDKQVRKALYMLVNRPFMLEKFEHNMSQPATGPIYVQSDYASPNVKPVPYDPAEALKILRAAGWSDSDKDGTLDKVIDGKKTNLSLTILEPSPDFIRYLTVYKEDASKVGVDINIKNVDWNTFVKLLDERNFDAVRLAWVGGTVDVDPKQIWHSDSAKGSGSNFISYANPKVDKLIDQARKIYEKEKRIPLMQQIHEEIAADYPYVFFFNNKYTLYGHTKRVQKPKDTFSYGVGTEFWTISE